MEIYVHRSGEERIELREVEEPTTVAEAVGVAKGEAVWLEDTEEVVDVTMTISEAGIGHRGHVHVNQCHKVEVDVNFNGETKNRSLPPSTTIKKVRHWATGKQGFNLSEEDREDHVLQLCGSSDQPEPSDHIGSFVRNGSCEVCFDLVPKHRIEG